MKKSIIKNKIFRIIDANLNRLREGLRVSEEIARFLLNSPTLTKRLKAVRHKINDTVKSLPRLEFLESRDIRGDVGKGAFAFENVRRDAGDVFSANLQRVKESLRVLEEFFKLIDEKKSLRFKILRFEVYDIEKNFFKKLASLRNLR